MIVRIRTNLGNWRVKVTGDDVTLDELRQETASQQKVSLEAVKLCREDGSTLVNGSLTLKQLGVGNGSMLVIKETLLQHVVEKAYIEDGVLVEAGVRIVASESNTYNEVDTKNDESIDTKESAAKESTVKAKALEAVEVDSNPYSAQVADAKPSVRHSMTSFDKARHPI
jgi:hypothetical protein